MEFGKLIFKCRVGSHLYGLNRPDSDEDFFSVFIPNAEYLLGLKEIEEVDNSTKGSEVKRKNNADDVDDKAYALQRFLKLLLDNNPNIVEVLFAKEENIILLEPEFQPLIDNYQNIISQKIRHTFSGYAFSQKKKLMVKQERYHSLQKGIEIVNAILSKRGKELYSFEDQLYEDEAEMLNEVIKYYKNTGHETQSFHKGMKLTLIKERLEQEYEQYGWRVKTDTFHKLGYDIKFGYHLIRLLHEGLELLTTGKLTFPIEGEAREQILRIRNAEVEYDELMEMYSKWDEKLVNAEAVVPHKPNWNWANAYLIETLRNHILKGE
jgi:uncharacterized protein